MNPNDVVKRFDSYLLARKASFQGIAIGGASLVIMGIITRETRDCDILDPDIPDEILKHAVAFAEEARLNGEVIRDDWFNNGPSSLRKHLPDGWRARTQPLFSGKSLTLITLGRSDLLRTKLFALCDRGTDLADCLALRPVKDELLGALPWVQLQDANVDWPKHVTEVLTDLAKGLGYEL